MEPGGNATSAAISAAVNRFGVDFPAFVAVVMEFSLIAINPFLPRRA
jgi:hypothetical protein